MLLNYQYYTLITFVDEWSEVADPHLVLGTEQRACRGTVVADEGPVRCEGRSAGIAVEEDGITLCVNTKTSRMNKPERLLSL